MADRMSERTEGWGSLDNARDAHYFNAEGRSLCGRWFTFKPRWEENQAVGAEATKGTCKGCWKKCVKDMAQSSHAQSTKQEAP